MGIKKHANLDLIHFSEKLNALRFMHVFTEARNKAKPLVLIAELLRIGDYYQSKDAVKS